jgi:glycerol-3-phosphate acyltransferase PlsY
MGTKVAVQGEDWGARPLDTGLLPRHIHDRRWLLAARASIVLSVLPAILYLIDSWELRGLALALYIYGGVPFPYLLVRTLRGRNIYAHGSRNGGVANGFRVGGYLVGSLIVLGEVSKVAIPALTSWIWYGFSPEVLTLLLMAVCLGTNFSIFTGLRGGMGVTLAIWGLLVLSPLSLLIALAIWLLCMKLVKDTFYQAMISFASVPLIVLLVTQDPYIVGFALLFAALFILRYDRTIDEFSLAKKEGYRPGV